LTRMLPAVLLLAACVSQGAGQTCRTVPLTEQTTTRGMMGCDVELTHGCNGPLPVNCIGAECRCMGSGGASVFDDAAFFSATSLIQVETVNTQCGWDGVHL
jgi:hypothetical protein